MVFFNYKEEVKMSKKENGVTKKCKHCQSEINVDAKICPNCRKKQGMALWLKIAIVIVVLAVLGSILGSSEEPSSSETQEKNDNKIDEEKKTFNQNETVEYKGIKYTILKVEKTNGKTYNKPKDGYEFIEVTIKIENTSDDKYSYSSYDWKMENSQGQELDGSPLYLIEYDDDLGSAELKTGGVVTGKLGFEQPKADNGLYLNYYENFVWDDDFSFQIKID